MDAVSILCIVALVVLIFVVGFCAWCVFKLSKHWNQLIFIKRRRLLTVSLLIQWGAIFVGFTVVIISIMSLYENPHSATTKILQVSSFCVFCVLITPAFTMLQYIYLARVWLLYYDMLLSKIQKNREWRMIIDPKTSNIIDNESKFALKNQNTLYKTKPVLKICIIALIIEYAIIGFPLLLTLNLTSKESEIFSFGGDGGSFLMTYMTAMCAIRVCLGFCIWRRMNRLKMIDNFGIRKEIGYMLRIVLFAILLFMCTSILQIVIHDLLELIDANTNQTIIQLTTCYCALICGSGMIYTTFIYPIRVYNKVSNDRDGIEINVKYDDTSMESINHWTQIMETEIGYEEFMDHLAKEFSTENLLFITEYIEIKKVLMDHFPHILDQLKKSHGRECSFFVEFATLGSDEYENLETRVNGLAPVRTLSGGLAKILSGSSSPVGSSGDEYQFSQQSLIARQLAERLIQLTNKSHNKENSIAIGDCIVFAFSQIYSKYVDDYGASFMINISHKNRQSLSKLLDDKYYKKWQKNNNTNCSDKEEFEINKMSMGNHLLRNEITNDSSNYVNSAKNKFDEQMEYILHLLIKDMEKAVKEVSNLMQDSFFRFKREKKHLFQHMVKSLSSTPIAEIE